MQFHPTSPTGCIVAPDALECEIRVEGLTAAEIRGLFLGQAGRMDWMELKTRPPVTATGAFNTSTEISDTALETDLPDGRVRIQSGGPGMVSVAAHHRVRDMLIPQSLYLLLAHQWAQAGILPVHGAALDATANPARESVSEGILVLGGKATGKSTLTAAALAVGARVVSDDWVLFGQDQVRQPRAERLRQFLMLRESWASDRIRQLLPAVQFQPGVGRPKSVFRIPPTGHPRFPFSTRISRIWVLTRPRGGRGQETRIRPLESADGLARLIEASMPLLYSSPMPIERELLMNTARQLLGNTDCTEIQTGTDLISQPQAVWARLIQG